MAGTFDITVEADAVKFMHKLLLYDITKFNSIVRRMLYKVDSDENFINELAYDILFQQYVGVVVAVFNSTPFQKVIDLVINFLFSERSRNEAEAVYNLRPCDFVRRWDALFMSSFAQSLMVRNIKFRSDHFDWRSIAARNNDFQNGTRFITMFDIPWHDKLNFYARFVGNPVGDLSSLMANGLTDNLGSWQEALQYPAYCATDAIVFCELFDLDDIRKNIPFNVLFNSPLEAEQLLAVDTFKPTSQYRKSPIGGNYSIPRQIFTKRYLTKIHKLRRQIFGPAEDETDTAILLAAWPDHGWLWVPIEYDL